MSPTPPTKRFWQWFSGCLNNQRTGKLSHSKLWANVAAAAATWQFVRSDFQPAEIWLAYLGLVGGYAAARKFLAQKDKP